MECKIFMRIIRKIKMEKTTCIIKIVEIRLNLKIINLVFHFPTFQINLKNKLQK